MSTIKIYTIGFTQKKLFQVEKETAHDFFRTMEIQSSAAAVENILLAATSLAWHSLARPYSIL